MTTYLAVMREIHVLLVDHDFDGVINATRQVLETYRYKVTHVEQAGEAMLILSKGEVKYDFVIADFNSPDLRAAVNLLESAVHFGIPMILMSVEYDINMATMIMELGAFLYIKTPKTLDMLIKCLWQHVAKENLRAMRERERLMAASYATPPQGIEFRETAQYYPAHQNPNNVVFPTPTATADNFKRRRDVEEEYSNSMSRVKRKSCTEWTRDLHEKFIKAVEELGPGSCFPKEILERMNVPGLTRMQVASHLQKCRNDDWRSPEERKSTVGGANPMSSDGGGSSQKPRRFGSMPRIVKSPTTSQVNEQASGGGQGLLNIHNEAGTGNNETIGGMTTNQSSYHQHYGALLPHPNNNGTTNFVQQLSSTTDGFFASDIDSMIQNLSAGMPPSFAGMNHHHPQSNSRSAFFDDHDHQTNSKGANMAGSTSTWCSSSETSNDFGTRAN